MFMVTASSSNLQTALTALLCHHVFEFDRMTTEPNELPFVADCRTLPYSAAFGWLRAGWKDLCKVPRITLIYGLVIFIVSWGVSLFAWWLGQFALLATLLSGFIYIAPMLAVGLHSVSKDMEDGRTASFRRSTRYMMKAIGDGGVYALMLLVILFIWSRSGMVLYAFFPVEEGDQQVLLEFLAVGSLIGTFFAALVFASAAFSLPMIVDKQTDIVTACISSINAVLRNKPAMLVWALCIVVLTAIGFATAYLGFVLIMPWLAFSAWHAYRATIIGSAWPERVDPEI
jgi:uncharacterized membrane protein